MNKLLFLLLLMIIFPAKAQVHWLTMEEAMAARQSVPKKILVFFYKPGNQSCHEMETKTFAHEVIAKYINDNFYPVKFNGESSEKIAFGGREFKPENHQRIESRHEFLRYMSVYTFPTTTFLDEKLQPITNVMGFLQPRELDPYLHIVASNFYKKIKTREQWENYQNRFKSKIKEKH